MTVTAAPSLPGMATGRPDPAPAREPAPGGYGFRDVLDGRGQPAAATATEGTHHPRSRDAGKTADDAHGRPDGRRQADDTGEEQDAPPLRDRLPLLVNLHRLSDRTHGGRPDAEAEDGKAKGADDPAKQASAENGNALAVSIAADAIAKAGEKGAAKGKAEDPSPAERISRQAPHAGTADGEAEARSVSTQTVNAAVRGAAQFQPDQAANQQRPVTPGKSLPGAAIDGTTDGASDPTATKTADATSPGMRAERVRVPAPGQKGGNDDAAQQHAGDRRQDDAARTVTVAANQSFAAPASHPMSQTTAGLVAAIAADNGFRQAVAMQSAAATVAVPTHVLKIELHPADLGSVTANLRMIGQQLSVELKPETHEAYRRLETDKDAIARSLKQLGLGVDSVTVLQPQLVSTPTARADMTPSATAAPPRDPSSFQPGNPNGNGGGPAGQQSGRQSERNSNDGRQDSARGTQASRIGAGGNLFI